MATACSPLGAALLAACAAGPARSGRAADPPIPSVTRSNPLGRQSSLSRCRSLAPRRPADPQAAARPSTPPSRADVAVLVYPIRGIGGGAFLCIRLPRGRAFDGAKRAAASDQVFLRPYFHRCLSRRRVRRPRGRVPGSLRMPVATGATAAPCATCSTVDRAAVASASRSAPSCTRVFRDCRPATVSGVCGYSSAPMGRNFPRARCCALPTSGGAGPPDVGARPFSVLISRASSQGRVPH